MDNCTSCISMRPIKKQDYIFCASKKKTKINEIRLYCPSSLLETVSTTLESGCRKGYISNMINPDPSCNPVPIVSVDVLNPTEIDENNSFSLDRDQDLKSDVYSLAPVKIKAVNPDHQCTIDGMKGRKVGVMYKIERNGGLYQWRRLIGYLSELEGGLISGYEISFDVVDPRGANRPLWMNFGDPQTTETGIDALTDFDGTGGCSGLLYSRTFTGVTGSIMVNDYTLPIDNSKTFVFQNGMLLAEEDVDNGYNIVGNNIVLDDSDSQSTYQVLVYA